MIRKEFSIIDFIDKLPKDEAYRLTESQYGNDMFDFISDYELGKITMYEEWYSTFERGRCQVDK